MGQYISKSALVAEIDRLITPENGHSMDKLLDFIDTLEVKEVDENEYINKYFKGWYVDLTDQGNILHTPDGNAGLVSVKEVAKHFFELGMTVSKK